MRKILFAMLAAMVMVFVAVSAAESTASHGSGITGAAPDGYVSVPLYTQPWSYYSGLNGKVYSSGQWLDQGISSNLMSWQVTTSGVELNDPANGFQGYPQSSSQGSIGAYESDVQYQMSNYASYISGASSLYNVPTDIIYSIMLVESSGGIGGGNVMQEGLYSGSFTAANGVTYSGAAASIYQAAADYIAPAIAKYGSNPMLVGAAYNAGNVYPATYYSGGVGNNVWYMMMYASSSSNGYTFGSYDWKLSVALNAVVAEIGGIDQKTTVPATYSVTFVESGLPYDTTWYVHFDGQTGSPYTYQSSSSSWTFTGISDGTYSYSIPNVDGYAASPSSGSVSVSGSNVQVDVHFSLIPVFKPGEYVTVDVSGLNLRAGPGTGYEILTVLSYGTVGIEGYGGMISADGYTWISATFGQNVGWVATQFLAIGSPSGEFSAGYNFWPSSEIYVSVSGLYVHPAPSLSSPNINLVDYGQTGWIEYGGLVYNSGYMWAPVVFSNGVIGWVAMNFLQPYSTSYTGSPVPGYYYTVQSGNTLWGIASTAYGNGNDYVYIMAANGLSSSYLYVGEVLYLPYF